MRTGTGRRQPPPARREWTARELPEKIWPFPLLSLLSGGTLLKPLSDVPPELFSRAAWRCPPPPHPPLSGPPHPPADGGSGAQRTYRAPPSPAAPVPAGAHRCCPAPGAASG